MTRHAGELTWAAVAPLIARWRLSVVPGQAGTWEVTSPTGPACRRVWLRDLPQAVIAVATQCEAALKGEEEA